MSNNPTSNPVEVTVTVTIPHPQQSDDNGNLDPFVDFAPAVTSEPQSGTGQQAASWPGQSSSVRR